MVKSSDILCQVFIPPADTSFPIGGELVTCHELKTHKLPREQQLEFWTRT